MVHQWCWKEAARRRRLRIGLRGRDVHVHFGVVERVCNDNLQYKFIVEEESERDLVDDKFEMHTN